MTAAAEARRKAGELYELALNLERENSRHSRRRESRGQALRAARRLRAQLSQLCCERDDAARDAVKL